MHWHVQVQVSGGSLTQRPAKLGRGVLVGLTSTESLGRVRSVLLEQMTSLENKKVLHRPSVINGTSS